MTDGDDTSNGKSHLVNMIEWNYTIRSCFYCFFCVCTLTRRKSPTLDLGWVSLKLYYINKHSAKLYRGSYCPTLHVLYCAQQFRDSLRMWLDVEMTTITIAFFGSFFTRSYHACVVPSIYMRGFLCVAVHKRIVRVALAIVSNLLSNSRTHTHTYNVENYSNWNSNLSIECTFFTR